MKRIFADANKNIIDLRKKMTASSHLFLPHSGIIAQIAAEKGNIGIIGMFAFSNGYFGISKRICFSQALFPWESDVDVSLLAFITARDNRADAFFYFYFLSLLRRFITRFLHSSCTICLHKDFYRSSNSSCISIIIHFEPRFHNYISQHINYDFERFHCRHVSDVNNEQSMVLAHRVSIEQPFK